jgi:hypothetical protein
LPTVQYHRRHSGSASDRVHPPAPGSAGPGTASLTCAWPGAAGGLTIPTHHRSSDPAPRAAGMPASVLPRIEATEPDRAGKPVTQPSDVHVRPRHRHSAGYRRPKRHRSETRLTGLLPWSPRKEDVKGRLNGLSSCPECVENARHSVARVIWHSMDAETVQRLDPQQRRVEHSNSPIERRRGFTPP